MFHFSQFIKGLKKNTTKDIYENEISKTEDNIQNKSTPIEQNTHDAIQYSEQSYREHILNVSKLQYKNIDTSNVNCNFPALSSVEKSFLQYIADKEILNMPIAAYWTYTYNINYETTITKLIKQGYITIKDVIDNLSCLKVSELKEILSKANLSKSGKKQDLINRIEKNLSKKQLQEYITIERPIFYLTDKGKEILKDFPKSATKDIDFENQCLYYIEKGDFNTAYKLICKWEMEKTMWRGLNVDWSKEYQTGLSPSAFSKYQTFFNLDNKNLKIKSAFILANMLGVGYDKQTLLAKRVADKSVSEDAIEYYREAFLKYFYGVK